MTQEQIKLAVLDKVRKNYPNASDVLKMDDIMQDKVSYAAASSINRYALFNPDTATDKTSFSRSHTFPLPKGKFYSITGIRCSLALKLSAAPSSSLSWNESVFVRESYFSFTLDKTTINPIYLADTLESFYTTQNGAPVSVPKQNFQAYYFSEPLIVSDQGDISLVFEPTPGFTTAAAAAGNPYAIISAAGTSAERHQIFVTLITQEWTVLQ